MDNSKNIAIKLFTHKTPIFKEERGKDFVIYGTETDSWRKNLYPNYLKKLYDHSGTHKAIINSKRDYICGNGWKIKEDISATDKKKLLSFIKINQDETLSRVVNRSLLSYLLYGGFALEVIWGKASKLIAEIRHIDLLNIRSNKDNSLFYYTKDWTKYNPEKNEDWKIIPAFDINNRKGNQILYFKNPDVSDKTYSEPEYTTTFIECDVEIASFHLNNLKNGFTSGTIITFLNGNPSDEEKKSLQKDVKEICQGSENGGGVLLSFADGKDRATMVEHLRPSDLDKQYDQLSKTVQEQIFIGHRVSSQMLFGVRVPGQLGGKSEMLEAWEFFKNSYVEVKQREIEEIFNNLAVINGCIPALELKEITHIMSSISPEKKWEVLTQEEKRKEVGLPEIVKDVTPKAESITAAINSLSPLVANKVLSSMTENEIRALASLPPIEGGDIIKGTIPEGATPTEMKLQLKKQRTEKEIGDHILKMFSECGTSQDDYDVIFKKKIKFAETDIGLRLIEGKILNIIKNDSRISLTDISKAVGIDIKEVAKAITNLMEAGLLEKDTENRNVITQIGGDVLKDQPESITRLFIKYRYEWIEPFTDDDLPQSRDFCKNLIQKKRLYTRSEIDNINNETGIDTWKQRGGWYNRGDGTNVPQCRHIWEQVTVKEKIKK